MTSKALFFKLMKEDFKKKIWIIVLGLIVSLFVNPIRVLMHIENTLVTNPLVDHKVMTDIIFYDLLPYNVGMSVVPAVIAFLLAIVGFSYLFNKKKVDLYHSLPIKRERLFLIIYLNGIISFLIVSVITSFVLILAIMSKGYLTVNILSTIGSILIATIIYFLLFYHVAIVAVMLTGNIITAALGSGVLYLYGWLMQDLLQNYFNQCFVSSYRINTDIIDYIPIISPVSSLIQWISIYNDVADINGGKLTLCLINALIQGVIALIVAIILYKKRESEVAGKAMAFKFAQPVIKVLLMLMLTLMGGLYCSLFARNGYNSLFWYWFGFIVAAILSHCIIEIIYHADFKACFQRKLQSCVIIAAAALIGSCFQYDLLGYDRYLPDENQVEYCSVNFDNINSELEPYKIKEDESGKKVLQYTNETEYYFEHMKLNDTKQVLEIAKQGILQARDPHVYQEVRRNREVPISYTIKYHLKNGKDVYRMYSADLDTIKEPLADIYQSKEYQDVEFFLKDVFEENLCDKILGFNGWNEKIFTLSGEQMQEFFNVYQEERCQLSIEDLQTQAPVIKLIPQIAGYQYEFNLEGYYVYPSFTKTLNKLKEMGVPTSDYESGLLADRIVSIDINDYGFFDYDNDKKDVYSEHHLTYLAENGEQDQKKIEELSKHLILAKFAWTNDALYKITEGIDCNIVYQNETGMSKESATYIKAGEIPAFVQDDIISENSQTK